MFKKAGWTIVKPPTPLIPDGQYYYFFNSHFIALQVQCSGIDHFSFIM